MTVKTQCCHTVAVGHQERCLETAGEFQSISALKHFAIVFLLVNSCSLSVLNGDTDFFFRVWSGIRYFTLPSNEAPRFGSVLPSPVGTEPLSQIQVMVFVSCVFSRVGSLPQAAVNQYLFLPDPITVQSLLPGQFL